MKSFNVFMVDDSIDPKKVISKLDSLPGWSLSYIFIGILGVGYFFTFYDIFNINVSFVQTAIEIIPNTLSITGPKFSYIEELLGYATLIQLIGYAIGTLILSPLSDKYGRRDMLLITMSLAAIGSLITVFTQNFIEFSAARFITGLGIGADIAIVYTYVSEVSPIGKRAAYGSIIFLFAALGSITAVWLGLYLTTPAAPIPLGLPFAIGGPGKFGGVIGWRLMYVVGAVLGLIGVLLRFELPESPRWLVSKGRIKEADNIVNNMMERIKKRTGKDIKILDNINVNVVPNASPYREILGNKMYLKRLVMLLFIWFIGYMAVYILAAGFTGILGSIGYTYAGGGFVVAVGSFGFIAAAIIPTYFGEHLHRREWLPIGATITLIGGLMIAFSGKTFFLSALGAIIAFCGFNIWVPVIEVWTTENFPARSRTTGFAFVDGVGHIGGGAGVLLVAYLLLLSVSPVIIFIMIAVFLFIPSAIARFGVKTNRARMDEISP